MTCGRLEVLRKKGKLDSLLRSDLRFSEKLAVMDAHRKGESPEIRATRTGPDLKQMIVGVILDKKDRQLILAYLLKKIIKL